LATGFDRDASSISIRTPSLRDIARVILRAGGEARGLELAADLA
jgi:hypothetical protein